MKTARHESLFGLDYGVRTPYQELTPQERTIVDFRHEHYPPLDQSYIGIQMGLPGVQQDMAFSPYSEAKAKLYDQERIDAITLEFKRMVRVY